MGRAFQLRDGMAMRLTCALGPKAEKLGLEGMAPADRVSTAG